MSTYSEIQSIEKHTALLFHFDNNRSLISDTDGGAGMTSAQDSQNDQSDNISQTGSILSDESSDVEDDGNLESKSKRWQEKQ